MTVRNRQTMGSTLTQLRSWRIIAKCKFRVSFKNCHTYFAFVFQFVRQQVHAQRRHTDVYFAAIGAFLGEITIQRSMRLFVTTQIAAGGVTFLAYVACIPLIVFLSHRIHSTFRPSVAYEQSIIRITDGDALLKLGRTVGIVLLVGTGRTPRNFVRHRRR